MMIINLKSFRLHKDNTVTKQKKGNNSTASGFRLHKDNIQ